MNQILYLQKLKHKYKYFFQFELVFSLMIILVCVFYLFHLIYKEKERELFSQSLVQHYNLSNLYSSINLEYEEVPNEPLIIGILEIPSISIKLPIISQSNDELLKLSICRFYGPLPNQVGNLCIAGHNYNDNSFFSNIPMLSIGDTIFLTDYLDNKIEYNVYNKYEVSSKDTSCTSQKTNGQKEITLVTCNNITGNRIIIKAK